MNVFTFFIRLLMLTAALLVTACTSLSELWSPRGQREGVSSSLVDYLYPNGEEPPDPERDIPKLSLPIRVGIAFVPPRSGTESAISEATKLDLLHKVKDAFTDRNYIAHIEVIPETYLRGSKGFEGMSQVARIYSVDVMALVSYDQVATSAETRKSILYWTIVGAYYFEGTKNDVHTFVDTAVFDVQTRKLLFRAPGTDIQEFRSTYVDSIETVREGRSESFAIAMTDMTRNLEVELVTFEQRLKTEPKLAEVTWEEGSSIGGGGGSLDFIVILALAVVAMSRPGSRFRRPSRQKARV